MLKLQNIDVALGQGTTLERCILDNLNLEVKTGEFVLLLGNNGAGKTTLFNVISGSIAPTKGTIHVGSEIVTDWPAHKRSPLISKVLQDPRIATIGQMTIEENLNFAYYRGKKRSLSFSNTPKKKSFFQEKLGLLGMGLENRLGEMAGNLSGGQRQALSLIMAIMAESKILLLDEITAALDPQMAETIMELTEKIVREEKRTTLMITHNLDHAAKYGDRVLHLKEGKISL